MISYGTRKRRRPLVSLREHGRRTKISRESKQADIGISLPGTGEEPAAPVFVDGKKFTTLRGPRIAEEFQALLEQYVHKRFGEGTEKVTSSSSAAE